MAFRIALAVIVFFLLSYFLTVYKKTPKGQQKQLLKNYGSLIAIALLVIFIATGKLNWLIGVVGSAGLLIWRNLFLLKKFAPFFFQLANKHTGFSPVIRTKFLKVQFSKNSLQGDVIEGPLKGRQLAELSSEDIETLSLYYKENDKESLLLLHAYIQQQNINPNSNQQNNNYHEPSSQELSQKEALEILGLDDSAGREEILKAHKKLLQRLHPDRGGSNYLAAKVNRAKDILIK